MDQACIFIFWNTLHETGHETSKQHQDGPVGHISKSTDGMFTLYWFLSVLKPRFSTAVLPFCALQGKAKQPPL